MPSDDLPKPKNMFREMQAGFTPQARAVDDLKRFEQKRAEYVLKRLKLKHHQRAICRQCEAVTGLFELRFAWFNEHFPTFPFMFGASKLQGIQVPWGENRQTPFDYQIHRDPYSVEPSRFKKFSWVPFVVAYREFYEAVAESARARKVALVFPRRGFAEGMVIHNDESENYWTEGLCWVYKFPDDRGPKLYVQPFSALIDAIYANGRGWRPEGE